MRKIAVMFFAMTTTQFVAAQTTIIEQRQSTENGVTKGWKITKEFDAEGNLIRYDSTSVNQDELNNPGNEFFFQFDGFNGPNIRTNTPNLNDSSFFDQYFHFSVPQDMDEGYHFFWGDTTLTPQHFESEIFNFDEFMRRHQEMMNQFFQDFDYERLLEQSVPQQEPKKEEGERI